MYFYENVIVIMRKKATITLKNLAEDLNLSVSTVSRALNNHQDIRPATKELVCSYAKKMNYFPNLFAKGFRSQKTHIIGLIVPQISNYFTSTVNFFCSFSIINFNGTWLNFTRIGYTSRGRCNWCIWRIVFSFLLQST